MSYYSWNHIAIWKQYETNLNNNIGKTVGLSKTSYYCWNYIAIWKQYENKHNVGLSKLVYYRLNHIAVWKQYDNSHNNNNISKTVGLYKITYFC